MSLIENEEEEKIVLCVPTMPCMSGHIRRVGIQMHESISKFCIGILLINIFRRFLINTQKNHMIFLSKLVAPLF